MKNLTKVFALGAALVASATFASATPISGSIFINGSDSYNSTAQTISFSGLGNVGGVSTGSLAGFADCNMCVTLPSVLGYGSGFVNPTQVFSVTETIGGVATTVALDLTAITGAQIIDIAGIPNLIVTGTGLLSETGYDTTAGVFSLDTSTTSGSTNDLTFNANSTAAPTPEPSSLILLGTGLLGSAGALLRRRRTA